MTHEKESKGRDEEPFTEGLAAFPTGHMSV